MLSAIPPALLVLLALLSLARAATNGYSTFELVPSASQAPLYPLGNFNVGQSVSFTLLLTDPASYASFDLSPTHFLIQLVRDDKITVIKSFSSGTPVCAASSKSCSLSYRIPSGQAGSLNLRIQGVSPTQDTDFLVAYDLSARVGGAVVRYSDFLRSHAMQLVYIESAQDYVVQLVSNTGSSSISVEVLKMAESPSKYKVDSAVAVTSAVVETNLTKFTAAIVTPGYYAIRVVVNSNPSFQRIRLIFSSDQYACPFSPSSTDRSRVYTGCVLPKSEPGLPCLNYNTLTKECTFCIAGYEVVNGRCDLLNPCGTRQFSHFGRCRDADPTCLTFDPFTGDCLTCNPTHELLSGKCELKILICGERQWKSNGTCSNASDSCLSFDGNTGNCLTCRVGALPAGPVCL